MQTNPNTAPDPMKVITGECRLSYCHLTKPRANNLQPGAEPKYGVTLLIPKTDYATKQRIDAAIAAATQDGIANSWKGVRPPNVPHPVWDGDGVRSTGEAFGPECKGHWVITASSKSRPGIVDPNLQPIIDESAIYSGMYGRVSIRFFAYNTAGKKGVGCGLNNVQKTRDGEPLASHSTPEDDFGGYTVTGPAPSYPNYAQPGMGSAASGYPTTAPQYGAQPQHMPQGAPQQAPSYAPQYNPGAPYPQQAAPYGVNQQAPAYGQQQYPQQHATGQPPMGPAPAGSGQAPHGYAQPAGTGINPLTGQPMTGPIMGVNVDPNTGMPF